MIPNHHYNQVVELYTTYHTRLVGYACSIVNDAHAAEDIVQDAFQSLLCYSKPLYHDTPEQNKPLIYKIVKNKSISYIRERHKLLPCCCLQDVNKSVSYEADLFVLFQELVFDLPLDARKILSLRLLMGYGYAEICQVTGLSYNNARQRFSRGTRHLKHNLAL